MKKWIVFLVLLFLYCSVNADYIDENTYTVIDCIDWDDSSWKAFDSNNPYQSLKTWIESTISYINTNFNKAWLEETASGKVFKIKINCSMNSIWFNNINLDFNWDKYNNKLIIEWTEKNSFVISDIYFSARINDKNRYNWSNITIKNAMFLNTTSNNYYFSHVSSIKILDSYIKLNSDQNIGNYWSYTYYNNKYYFFVNPFYIENTKIDIELDKNYRFWTPAIMKDSYISFKNIDENSKYNIDFYQLHSASTTIYWFIPKVLFISNIIDLWWNNFKTTNSIKMSYLNNKFINIKDMIFWEANDKDSNTVFINNYIWNNDELNISHYKNLYNNIFKSWYSSSYDLFNLRRNFKESDNNKNWLWWIFKIRSNLDFFNINMDNFKLYKELTGNELDKSKKWVYIIYE